LIGSNAVTESNNVSGDTNLKMNKAHSLTGRITEQVMLKAFKAVKKNRGAAGIDKMSIKKFEQNLEENLNKLMKQLKDRSYRPLALRREYIPKGGGKFRPLGIPAVRDRVAQEVVRRLIEPYFEPYFSENSFGFRPGRNCHQAVREIIKLRKLGYRIVLDADIKGFFDNIPHVLIMKLVANRIADGNILGIIQKILASGVMEEGQLKETVMGTPQGGVISPLLANIVLDVLDHELAVRGYIFVRYADDFVVLAKSTSEIEKAFDVVGKVIEGNLGLKLSPEKTKITSFVEGFDFLGFHFSHSRVTIRAKSMEKIFDKIKIMTIRSHNFSKDQIQKINRVLRGLANYYATDFSSVNMQFNQIDRFVRRRLRCMKLKRISYDNNRKLTNRFFERRKLLSLVSFI
jgi:group II intron reverse transcriptase/maturase